MGSKAVVLNNALADRAETVRELIAGACAAHIESINKALAAGHHLVAAKDECKHGEWLPFLTRAGVHERQARRLMQVARAGLKSDTVSDLGGIKSALEFLAKRKLPDAGSSLIVFGNDERDYFKAAYVWGSTARPGYFYVAAYNGLEGVVTPRPMNGEPVIIPGHEPLHAVWAWVETHLWARQPDWRFETSGDAVAAIMFGSFHLEVFESEERAKFNLCNVQGLQELIKQTHRYPQAA